MSEDSSTVCRSIGVYGGTFDPIHNGHLEVAEAACERFRFDRLLFVPAWSPPHKRGREITNACHRFAMASLALADRKDWLLSTVEVESPSTPYTVETIARLGERYPEATPLYFIMGADSFEDLAKWHDYLRLVESCNIIVTGRPGHRLGADHLPETVRNRIVDLHDSAFDGAGESPAPEAGTHIYLVRGEFLDLSATTIRETVGAGGPFRSMVPERVADYIEKQRLYKRENE